MNRQLISILTVLMTATSFSAQSALILTGTRFIYDGDAKAISVTVQNNAKTPYGAQLWIESVDGSDNIPFSVTPSIFTLKAEGGEQVVQVAQLNAGQLKTNQETLFNINLQEIPPKSKDSLDKNQLVMASRIIVKMMYRPASIHDGRDKAEENMLITRNDDRFTFHNPTPYYFAVISINDDEDAASESFNRMMPRSQNTTTVKGVTGNIINFAAIDDYGGIRNYTCDLTKKAQQCRFIKVK